jgi:hypothetical protein
VRKRIAVASIVCVGFAASGCGAPAALGRVSAPEREAYLQCLPATEAASCGPDPTSACLDRDADRYARLPSEQARRRDLVSRGCARNVARYYGQDVYAAEDGPLTAARVLRASGTPPEGRVTERYDEFRRERALTAEMPVGDFVLSIVGIAGQDPAAIALQSASPDWRYVRCHTLDLLADASPVPVDRVDHGGRRHPHGVVEYVSASIVRADLARWAAAQRARGRLCNTEFDLHERRRERRVARGALSGARPGTNSRPTPPRRRRSAPAPMRCCRGRTRGTARCPSPRRWPPRARGTFAARSPAA